MRKAKTITFIYDGECSMCRSILTVRPKNKLKEVVYIDAKNEPAHPKVVALAELNINIEDGIVIEHKEQFLQGKPALQWIIKYADPQAGMVTRMLKQPKPVFGYPKSTPKTMHPHNYRSGSEMLLYHPDFGRKNNEPTFKSIFGASWDALPSVMKAHYANRPYSDDVGICEGTLDVMCKPPLKWLAPIMKLFGQIPPVNETNVPVTVRFKSDWNSKAFHFIRTFRFKAGTYVFHSRMVQIKDNEVIEIMRFGLGWRMLYSWDGEKVVLAHKGYVLHAFGHFIPLPLTLLMGEGYAEEHAIDDKTFDMFTHITHPWWGKIYEYKGRFEVKG